MTHPSVDEILFAATPEVRAHLAGCDACRGLAALGDAGVEQGDLPPPTLERAVYADRQEIHRGGMGRMSRARDRRLGRDVAIKEMLGAEEIGDVWLRTRYQRRFEREALLTARLQHPAIIAIYEAGRWEDGEPFYAMPLVRGLPLDREIATRPNLQRRLELLGNLITVCDAIAYAHDQGIVHRDLKPENILVGSFGETVVIDWGLARDRLHTDPEVEGPARDGLTQLGVGTPVYMPPEQARGEEPTERADVYALGATLYHLIAGAAPYSGVPREDSRALVKREAPPPLISIAPEVPPALADLIARAMARDATDRFASAREMADELRRFTAGELTRSRKHSLGDLIRHVLRRYRGILRVAAVALVAIAVLIAISVTRLARERDRANTGEQAARAELARSQGTIASQLASSTDRRVETLRAALAATSGATPPPEAIQGLFDAVSAAPSRQVLVRTGVLHGIFDATGIGVTAVGPGGRILWFDAVTGELRATAASKMASPEVMRSSGKWLVIVGLDGAERWDTVAHTGIPLAGHTGPVIGAVFVDGGTAIVTAGQDAFAIEHDVVTGAERARLKLSGPATSVTALPDGVLIGLASGRIVTWSGGRSVELTAHDRQVIGASRMTDGVVITASLDGDLLRWPTLTDGAATKLFAGVGRAGGLWTGGTRIALHRRQPDFIVLDLATEALTTIPGEIYWGEALTPAGDRLITGSKRGIIHIWDAGTGVGLTRFEAQRASLLALSPDKDRALALGDGVAAIWDARLGLATGMVAVHDSEVVAIDVAGERIAIASIDGEIRTTTFRDPAKLTASRFGEEVLGARFDARGVLVVAGIDKVRHGSTILEGQRGITAALPLPRGGVLTTALDGTAWLRDAAGTHRELATGLPITAAAVSRDATRAAFGNQAGVVTIVDLASGRELATRTLTIPIEGGIHALAFSPDGARVIAAGSTATLLCPTDLSSAVELAGLPHGDPFAPDGTRFATATPDGRVHVHRVGGPSLILDGHTGLVTSMAWGGSGTLVTGSLDGTARVWNVDGGTHQIVHRGAPVTAVATAEDGRWAITAAAGVVRIDPTRLDDARERACATLTFLGQTCAAAP